MITRRTLLQSAGAGTLGAAAIPAAAAPPETRKFSGPHGMPHNLTLLSIRNADGTESLGVKLESGILDVRAAAKKLNLPAPDTLDQLLQESRGPELTSLVDAAQKAKIPLLAESAITHGKLFSHPGKIICVGLNYRRHAEEVKMAFPKWPVLFSKFDNSLAGHNSTIKLPPKDVAYKFDYETELLIVMGKTAYDVSEEEALSYVAGYCTSNDFSARDLQLETGGQWLIGKTLDNFAPIGPYFVSADKVPNPNDLKLTTTVNGETRQDWSTNDFIFNCQQQISYISKMWPLEPGDIIFTGTPQGVILGKPKEEQVWLKAGDKITSTLEGLGTLAFTLS